jgi:transposase
MEQTYRRQILEPLGHVTGMGDECGIGEGVEHATPQHPERRDFTGGEAVKAMGLNGLWVSQSSPVPGPRCFHHEPTSRLSSPRVAPAHLNDDALGRAWNTLDAAGVPARYRLIATTAAKRLGLAPRMAPIDRTSVPVDGRENRAEEPEAGGMHITRGDSRDHRPDLNHVMLALKVEPQAGIPLLRPPLSGHSSDVQEGGQVIRAHLAPLQTTDGLPSLVAGRAL